MALLQVYYLSEAIKRVVTFHMYLPNDVQDEFKDGNPHYQRGTKTLYLLHGFTGNAADWVSGSDTMELSRKYNLAIVMPSGENSFYIDRKATGQAYETHVSRELREYVSSTFGLSDKKEDVYIGGLSMGGFGAIRMGIRNSNRYGAAFGLSSALIIDEVSRLTPDNKEGFALQLANYEYYYEIFGDPGKIKESVCNPEFLVKENRKNGIKTLPLFLACGTEDALVENNRRFRNFLQEQGEEVVYHESAGIHDWKFWNEYLEPAIIWVLDRGSREKGEEK